MRGTPTILLALLLVTASGLGACSRGGSGSDDSGITAAEIEDQVEQQTLDRYDRLISVSCPDVVSLEREESITCESLDETLHERQQVEVYRRDDGDYAWELAPFLDPDRIAEVIEDDVAKQVENSKIEVTCEKVQIKLGRTSSCTMKLGIATRKIEVTQTDERGSIDWEAVGAAKG